MGLFLVLLSTHTHKVTHTMSKGIFRWEYVIKPNRFPLWPLSESILLLSLFLPGPSSAISWRLHHVEQEQKKRADLLFASQWPLGLYQRLCGSVVINNFCPPCFLFYWEKKPKSCVLNSFFSPALYFKGFKWHCVSFSSGFGDERRKILMGFFREFRSSWDTDWLISVSITPAAKEKHVHV